MVKRDVAILLAALAAVFGLTTAIFAMSPQTKRHVLVRSASTTCGNLSCEVEGGETNLTCPSDCKALTIDPTSVVQGVGGVIRMFSNEIYNGGEKWFVDANGVQTHDGPYPPQLTTNNHGYPFNVPASAAAGPGRIELRSSSFEPNIIVEAYAFVTVEPGAPGVVCGNNACEAGEDAIKCPVDCSGGSCQVGSSCNTAAECGGGVCAGAGKFCEMTGVACDSGVCEGLNQTCEFIDPSKPGICSISRAPCSSNTECGSYVPTCVQKVGACQQCPSTCVEGAVCANDLACGTGSCQNVTSVCSRTGLACGADGSCPSAPGRCIDQGDGKKLCETNGPAMVACTTDADCPALTDICSTVGSCACAPQIVDTDKDGVEDGKDLCVATAEGVLVDMNGCSDDQVDTDGDGVCNVSAVSTGPSICSGKDQCEIVAGKGEYQGCPAALRVSVQIVDAQAKQKIDQPLQTRIFSTSAGSCADNVGTESPLNFPYIFDICHAENVMPLDETDSDGRFVADLVSFGVTTGPKLVLVESPIGANGSSAYQAFTVTVASNKAYNLGFEITPATSETYVQNSYFSKDSRGNYHGSRKQTVTGSVLEIVMPDYSLWTSNQELYPFIFISDSEWAVDICLQVPEGYKVAGDADCSSVSVNGEVEVIEFAVQDLASPEPVMKSTITATRNGKKTTLKGEHRGFRIRGKRR